MNNISNLGKIMEEIEGNKICGLISFISFISFFIASFWNLKLIFFSFLAAVFVIMFQIDERYWSTKYHLIKLLKKKK